MKHDQTPPFEDELRQALQSVEAECTAGESALDILLAEYLDGVLPASQQHEIETHLAKCSVCRQVVSEASTALGDTALLGARPTTDVADDIARAPAASLPTIAPVPAEQATDSSRGKIWALAAILVLALGTGWWWQTTNDALLTGDPRWLSLEITPELLADVDANVLRRAEAALAGQLPTPDLFGEAFGGSQPVLRGANLPSGPLPASPRWSAIRQPRPTFEWYVEDITPEQQLTGELLVVDADEQLVATIPFQTGADEQQESTLMSRPWPAELAPLKAGQLYAWKASLEIDGDWLSSEYVPFRVLADDAVAARLAPVAGNDFLAGIELAELGLLDEAAARFALLPPGAVDSQELLLRVLEHKRLDPRTLQLELARWTASSADSASQP